MGRFGNVRALVRNLRRIDEGALSVPAVLLMRKPSGPSVGSEIVKGVVNRAREERLRRLPPGEVDSGFDLKS